MNPQEREATWNSLTNYAAPWKFTEEDMNEYLAQLEQDVGTRRHDSIMHGITADEWPTIRDALLTYWQEHAEGLCHDCGEVTVRRGDETFCPACDGVR